MAQREIPKEATMLYWLAGALLDTRKHFPPSGEVPQAEIERMIGASGGTLSKLEDAKHWPLGRKASDTSSGWDLDTIVQAYAEVGQTSTVEIWSRATANLGVLGPHALTMRAMASLFDTAHDEARTELARRERQARRRRS